MRAQAGFHANDVRWQPLKHIFEAQPPDLPAKRDRSIGAQSNEVKYLLADRHRLPPVMPWWSPSSASSLLLLFIVASR
jgi:hypothetical protein